MTQPQTGLNGRPPLSAEEVQQMRISRAAQAYMQRTIAPTPPLANTLGALPNGGHWPTPTPLQSYTTNTPHFSTGGTAAQQALAQLAYAQALGVTGAQSFVPVNPPEPIEDAGIRPGEVRAYRCWQVKQGFLRSMVMEDIWAPGEPMVGKAEDGNGGVHAWKSLSKALTYGMAAYTEVVVGQVDLWGDIVEHEHGYRAENAAIVSLDGILGGKAPMLEALRKRYGVGGPEVGVPDWPEVEWARELGVDKSPGIKDFAWYEATGLFFLGVAAVLAVVAIVGAIAGLFM